MDNKKILIIVPAYNECGSIQKTIKEIFTLPFPVNVLVVNDGSSDNTALEAQKTAAFVISLPFNVGIGGAVQTGFKFAEKYQYDLAVQVDGDGQHDVTYLKNLIDPILDDDFDIVIGSRFLEPTEGYRSSFIRRIGITFFSHLISFLTRCKITDPTSGFRAYNMRAIKTFSQYYPTDYPEPESIVVAKQGALQVKEVPVKMRKRLQGHSSIRYFYTLYYLVKVTLAILIHMMKKNKRLR